MITRRFILAAALLPGALGSVASAEPSAFDQAAFEAAQAAGRPILVEITAPWCPICKTQRPIIARLAQEPRFRDLAVFEVDFDGRKDVVRALNARMQSTLIAYRGRTEVGRSVGETQAEWIESFLEKTL